MKNIDSKILTNLNRCEQYIVRVIATLCSSSCIVRFHISPLADCLKVALKFWSVWFIRKNHCRDLLSRKKISTFEVNKSVCFSLKAGSIAPFVLVIVSWMMFLFFSYNILPPFMCRTLVVYPWKTGMSNLSSKLGFRTNSYSVYNLSLLTVGT